jgi:hypothetical protein
MARTRAADDFATIRARMEELRREREGADKVSAPEPVPVRDRNVRQVAIAFHRGRARLIIEPTPTADAAVGRSDRSPE